MKSVLEHPRSPILSENVVTGRHSLAQVVLSLVKILSVVTGFCFVLAIPTNGAPGTKNPGYGKSSYVLPPSIQKSSFIFCREKIPLVRRDVSSRIVDQLNFLLMDRRAVLMESFDRMSIFGPSMVDVLNEEKAPRDLIYVAVLLSDLSPNARVQNGGVGWWSIAGPTDKRNSSQASWMSTEDWDDRRDYVISTRIASKTFKGLIQQPHFKNWLLAVSAFLDGPDKIEGLVKKFPGFSYWDIVMPPLSDVLIPRAVALKIIDTNKEFYSVNVPLLKPASYDVLDRLLLQKPLPLSVVAKWCHISPRGLWELNPGVDIANGVLPKANSKSSGALLIRVPRGKGDQIRSLLTKEGYIASGPH